MQSFLQLSIAILLLAYGAQGRAIDDMDNSIQIAEPAKPSSVDWLKISEAPPEKIVQPLGTTIELECEVTGSPTPTIHWVRGTNPKHSISSFDENLIVETAGLSVASVRSRLIIDHIVPSERSFTCVGRTASEIVHATTTIYSTPAKPHNITELLAFNNNLLDGPKKARIVLYYTAIFKMMGSNIMLPCNVAGRPRPEIYWLDPDNRIIGNDDPRMTVLPSGTLSINDLRWVDMGSYTCIARNALAKDSISTFVYPVLNDPK